MLAGSFGLPQFFGWPTTRGLINLNMIRHPQVLNALLDNDQVIYDPRYYPLAPQPAGFPTPVYPATVANVQGMNLYSMDPTDSNRQWWLEFLKSRDSRFVSGSAFTVDPVTGLYMPGTANARPFRAVDAIGPVALNTTTLDSPIENTIFRSLPLDAASLPVGANINDARRLFEVGNTTTDHFAPMNNELTNTPVHPSVRHQLLTKIMNNTTTRSNTFGIYITVQYYQAVQVQGTSAAGNVTAVRIGGQATDIPTNRSFFVVDRTGAVDQMKTLTANVQNGTIAVTNPTFPVSPASYSFQPNTDSTGLRSKMNGIRWQDLVLYRQKLNYCGSR